MLILAGLVISLVSLGCQFLNFLQEGNPSGILFMDDFSNPTSGWKQVDAPQGNLAYLMGGYQIEVNQPFSQIWSTPGLKFSDARIEVVASKLSGEDDNFFGIICRQQEINQFYALVISSDGYYGIARFQDSGLQLLGKNAMAPSEAILQGSTTNHLSAECVGDVLRLAVNGQVVYEVQDAAYSKGEVGLIAGSQATPGVTIVFDDFQVFKP